MGNFDKLRFGMTEAQVESIFGQPHRKAGGEIVQLERPGSIELRGTIQEQPDSPDGNRMNVYQGCNEESIEVLFWREGIVIAAEYRVSDYPVMYRGPRVAQRSQDLAVIATSRSAVLARSRGRRKLLGAISEEECWKSVG